MSGTKVSAEQHARDAAKAKAIADEKARIAEASKAPVAEPTMTGYEETQPGQVEIVAGTVEHVQLLNSYPNATTYGPDVNVVVPPSPEGGGDPMAVHTPVGTTLSPAGSKHEDTPANKSKQ